MSRMTYLVGTAIALVALALAATDWALSLQPGVTEANVRRIRVGMTLPEVESIFGGPPKERLNHWEAGPPISCAWYGGRGDVIVDFRKDGRVRRADWHAQATEPSSLDRVRGWLGL